MSGPIPPVPAGNIVHLRAPNSTVSADGTIQATTTGTLPNQGTVVYLAGLHIFETWDGAPQFEVGTQPNASNFWQAIGGQSGIGPTLYAQGTDTNVPAIIAAKGTGTLYLGNGSGQIVRLTDAGGPPVNVLQVNGGLSNADVLLRVVTNPGDGLPGNLNLWALLNGHVAISNDDGPLAVFNDANAAGTPAVGYFTFTTQSSGGTAPTISVTGSTNNSIKLVSKGTGTAQISANGTGSVQVAIASDKLGFYGATPIVKPTVSGAWAGNTAGKATTQLLQSLGLCIDSTTA